MKTRAIAKVYPFVSIVVCLLSGVGGWGKEFDSQRTEPIQAWRLLNLALYGEILGSLKK